MLYNYLPIFWKTFWKHFLSYWVLMIFSVACYLSQHNYNQSEKIHVCAYAWILWLSDKIPCITILKIYFTLQLANQMSMKQNQSKHSLMFIRANNRKHHFPKTKPIIFPTIFPITFVKSYVNLACVDSICKFSSQILSFSA